MTFSQRWHAFFDKPIPNIILRLVLDKATNLYSVLNKRTKEKVEQ